MPLPDDILVKIKDLERRLDNLERFPQPPTIVESNVATAQFVVGAAGSSNDKTLVTATLHNFNNLRLMAIPRMTVYLHWTGMDPPFIESFHLWPFESEGGWTDTMLDGLDIIPFPTFTPDDADSPNDIAFNVLFRNRAAIGYPLHVEFDWRFPALEGGQ